MKVKKAKVVLELVSENLEKFKAQAFFGVSADAPEIQAIWNDYNYVRTVLIEHNPELYSDLLEVKLPRPGVASSMSLLDVGASMYSPRHFETIENEIRKAQKYVILEDGDANIIEQVIPENISINARDGSNVTVQIGNENQALQNSERINNTLSQIGELGIEEEDLLDLKQILSPQVNKTETKTGIGKRIMNWSGKMAGKLIEKGLTDNIPVLMEKASTLIDLI
ncbi:hypothetical protein Q4512_16340 [Oceanihabitans sp. 2_MG-2023]|uniref:hypothetical protein n=1 Tax=Oceanihabitans sp. 2_MG-2023 TaxID=3062661 RepID=UPI0026E1FE9E|nr:hypothetical protein [Oceanihabitans sp. 2_MG-2023]MDO6598490.1 hypothetical protein [Oceanihabitans sp. 2_MG-2023]